MPMPRRTTLAHLATASALGVLLTACQSSTPAGQTHPQPASASPQQQSTTTPPRAATDPGLTPRERLLTLAGNVGGTPADAATGLPYTYLHTQSWTRATNKITRTDLQRWRRDADDSGREVTRRLPDVPGLAHRPTQAERDDFATARRTTTPYLAGDLKAYLTEPLPTDATALASALAPRELAGRPAYPRILVHGVTGLATHQYLNQDQRRTTLRVLAAVPNIAYQGEQTDLAGRTGLGFTLTADGSTTQLIIKPDTGELLSAQEQVAGARPGLFSCVLILDRGHAVNDTETPSTQP
ncbi:hypothetical protein AB0J14_25320 [Micromonospora arborensis]|uniref:hypothetical protein n=1 Tax=Micromonospora arborensis TaxID=2116518 RepID=UPI00341021DD